MSKYYTLDAWVRDFKPQTNPKNNWGDGHYSAWETYGDELEYVLQQDEHNVWTEMDGDNGTYIVSGAWRVNRVQYFITTVPWTEDITVPTNVYEYCECIERMEENGLSSMGDPDPACLVCWEGTIELPIDTAKDLKAIFGETVEVVE